MSLSFGLKIASHPIWTMRDISGQKRADAPKLVGPEAGTIVPSVKPSNKTGSDPGPPEYAKIQRAVALLFSKPSSILFRPTILSAKDV